MKSFIAHCYRCGAEVVRQMPKPFYSCFPCKRKRQAACDKERQLTRKVAA